MKRIVLAVVAALGLVVGSGTALAQHGGGGHGGGGHGGGWHGGGGHGSWHGGHGGFHGGTRFAIGFGFPGFYWGPGWGYPYYGYAGYPYYASYPNYASYHYSYPDYYPDDGVYGQSGPSGYIQRDMSSGAQGSGPPVGEAQYSYYCPDPAGYYPQVQNCAKGWLKVVPDGAPRPRTR